MHSFWRSLPSVPLTYRLDDCRAIPSHCVQRKNLHPMPSATLIHIQCKVLFVDGTASMHACMHQHLRRIHVCRRKMYIVSDHALLIRTYSCMDQYTVLWTMFVLSKSMYYPSTYFMSSTWNSAATTSIRVLLPKGHRKVYSESEVQKRNTCTRSSAQAFVQPEPLPLTPR